MVYFQSTWKVFTVAYKVPRFEMIRLYLNIEDSLRFFGFYFFFFFFFFLFGTLHTQNS